MIVTEAAFDSGEGLNRKQRRQLAKDRRRNIDRSGRVVDLPKMLDEFTVFDIPQSILDSIAGGDLYFRGSNAIFRDNTGVWQDIVPALQGWIYTWARVSKQMSLGLDLAALSRITKKLTVHSPITVNEIESARQCLDIVRLAFRTNDRKKICSITKDAQLAMLLVDEI